MKSALETPLADIEKAMLMVQGQHDEISQSFETRMSTLNETSDRARETADHIRNTLREQSQDISTLTGQLSGQTRAINEQLEQQRVILEEEVIVPL